MFIGALATVFLAACRVAGDLDPEPTDLEVVVLPAEAEIAVDERVQLTAEVRGEGDPSQDVRWSSEDEQIATVDDEGEVTGVASGQTIIAAVSVADPNASGSARITVTTRADLGFQTLQPEGTVTAIDGVLVGAPSDALDDDIDILVERVDDPRPDPPFPAYLENARVVGEFYAVSASRHYRTPSGNYLLIGLPVPADVSTDDLALVLLTPPDSVIMDEEHDDPSYRWSPLRGAFDADSGVFGTLLPTVGPRPQVFALVEGVGYEPVEDTEDHDGASQAQFLPFPPIAFRVECIGFAEGECTLAHRQATRAALDEARSVYVGELGFREPNLRQVLRTIAFGPFTVFAPSVAPSVAPSFAPTFGLLINQYEYELRRGSHNGWYQPASRSAATVFPGAPDEPEPFVTRHELFHAIQFAYDALDQNWAEAFDWELRRTVEAAATAAEVSLEQLRRSNATLGGAEIASRQPLSVTSGLWSSATISPRDYAAQDFLVYLGRVIDPDDPQLTFMIPWFELGGFIADLDSALQNEGTFDSLAAAYWAWVKNQTFEKGVSLGPDYDDEPVPGGPSCDLYETVAQAEEIVFTLDAWQDAATDFTLAPLTALVFRVTLEAEEASYETTASVSPSAADLEMKVYSPTEAGSDACRERADNEAQQVVYEVHGQQTVSYVLLANTSSSQQIQGNLAFTGPLRHEVTDIVFNPVSPQTLCTGQAVDFTFSYTTGRDSGVRVFGRPFSDGELTPDRSAHASPLYPVGDGDGSGFFRVLSEATVDEVRFQMWDADQTQLLFETFVPVQYQIEHDHEVSNVEFDPESPAALSPGDDVSFTFDYRTCEPGGVRIFGRPFSDGELTPNRSAHPSPLHPVGAGDGDGFFTVHTRATVDEVRFQMWNANQTRILHEMFIPVNYGFVELF